MLISTVTPIPKNEAFFSSVNYEVRHTSEGGKCSQSTQLV